VAQAARRAGIRASVGLILIDFPTAWADGPGEYLEKGLRLHDEVKNLELVTTVFAPHAPYTVSDEPLTKLRVLADELDIPVHMHVHETEHEVEESMNRYGVRPLERLSQLGLLTNRLIAVHMTQLLSAEIEAIANSGVHVVHCPESNLKLASGMCPVTELLGAQVNVALGTDGAASNNDLDMLGELRTAALLAKGVSGDPTAVPAHTALEMATINGAKALGLEHTIGSIEVGKQADLVAVDLNQLDTQPVYHALTQLVYSASRSDVTHVWVRGRKLLADRQLLTLDQSSVFSAAAAWAEKIGGLQ
ncbi:MAG: amidohydrolase family protein, partial [Gammaproteobacteria bacterium]|nr:amidohydrolase family protein [Gammaproteobacteria bacterium]